VVRAADAERVAVRVGAHTRPVPMCPMRAHVLDDDGLARICCARAITIAADRSVGPPAEAGTIAVMGRVGKDCARRGGGWRERRECGTSNLRMGNAPPSFTGRLARRGSGLEARVEIVAPVNRRTG